VEVFLSKQRTKPDFLTTFARIMILVTGGNGFLGAYLLRQLLKNGEKIRATKRPNSDLSLVAEFKDQIEWVEADMLDIIALEEAIDGVDKVYHSAAIVSFNPSRYDEIMKANVEGTANLVNLCIDSGVQKLLHVSSIAAFGKPKNGASITEKSDWEKSKINSVYSISKYCSENEVWRGIAEGLNAVIVNPSIILGSGFWNSGTPRICAKVWNKFPFYTTGVSGFVDVRDTVDIMIQLMDSEITNERFIINADSISYQKILNMYADSLQVKKPHIRATRFMSEVVWRLEAFLGIFGGGERYVTKELAAFANSSFYYSNEKVKEALNFEFRPLEETIEDITKVFKAHQPAPAMLP